MNRGIAIACSKRQSIFHCRPRSVGKLLATNIITKYLEKEAFGQKIDQSSK